MLYLFMCGVCGFCRLWGFSEKFVLGKLFVLVMRISLVYVRVFCLCFNYFGRAFCNGFYRRYIFLRCWVICMLCVLYSYVLHLFFLKGMIVCVLWCLMCRGCMLLLRLFCVF